MSFSLWTVFVYQSVRLLGTGCTQRIEIIVRSREGSQGKCSHCQKPSSGYDTLLARRWDFVPLWAIAVYFVYASRRVECAEHGIVVEHVPWSSDKSPLTMAMMAFLATWARRLSWRETAPKVTEAGFIIDYPSMNAWSGISIFTGLSSS